MSADGDRRTRADGMSTAGASNLMTLQARRLEELSLNASGAFQSLVYDGWLLGFRPGRTKRLRCVNAFYSTSLPLAEKIDHCVRFYRSVDLPPIFRMLPFSQPPELDRYLESLDWVRFERTLMLRAEVPATPCLTAPTSSVEIVDVARWVEATAGLLGVADQALQAAIDRAQAYPLPHLGAIVRQREEVVACGLAKLEADHAGLFAVKTAPAHRRRGLGRVIIAALLAESSRRGAQVAYLQVTADNEPALALYRPFGFTPVYDYWYRGRPSECA